ncbi:hypothetical protein, variant [Phialophora macrospora]|uniref:Major facilitator superfamily (MFS) profile domain-containing protein n=1 Tax=Phialophora macrospora TaxID=1851006 RepID=A0A0D2GKA1_9EURO|nr:hypothetical protein PV04_00985 [Phialophora macrospora]KIW72815.1 hypothetical protein, variant [Phialophora macrospora]
MHTIDATTSPGHIYGYSILLGIGSGCAMQSGYGIAAATVEPHAIPAAIGFVNVAQAGTIVIALTIAGAVFQNTAFDGLKQALHGLENGNTTLFTDAEIRSAIAGTQSAIFQAGNSQPRDDAVRVIVTFIDNVFILPLVAGIVTLIASAFMKREKLFTPAVAGGG